MSSPRSTRGSTSTASQRLPHSGGRDEILAKTLVVIVTFIPFFGFWEIDRVLGHGKLFELFFHKRTA